MKELTDNFKHVFLNNYINFSGRADRTELWLFNLVLYMIFMILYLLMYPFIIMSSIMSTHAANDGLHMVGGLLIVYAVLFLVMLAFFLPSLGLAVRRLHDTNRSGWFVLLNLIPLFGGLVLMVILSLNGDRGTNKYGDDPKIKKYAMRYGGLSR